jgi:hypothetical protein
MAAKITAETKKFAMIMTVCTKLPGKPKKLVM